MNKVIWKYELSNDRFQRLDIPEGYEVLTLQVQRGVPCIWVLVNPTNQKVFAEVSVYMTGETFNDINYNKRYVGTWQDQELQLVRHVFIAGGSRGELNR